MLLWLTVSGLEKNTASSRHQQAADVLVELLEALHDQEKYRTLLLVFSSLSACVGGLFGGTCTLEFMLN